ncbi:MAG: PAS domain-containing protein [Thermoleophilia bacterium]|nr:PAS domain-containing protein [Thermoleophilia bacterium]
MDVFDLLGRTADGMVAVGPGGAILAWNAAAESLLEHQEAEVVGRPCHEVLEFVDRCGNSVCSAFCTGCRPTESGELVGCRDVVARSRSGRAVWLSVSTLVPPPEVRRYCRLVHFFREVALPPELERLVADRLRLATAPPETAPTDGAAHLATLTPREREILGLLADGLDTREIATALVVSLATVRNHVQNILAKLGVHSRLEAVVLFVRHAT